MRGLTALAGERLEHQREENDLHHLNTRVLLHYFFCNHRGPISTISRMWEPSDNQKQLRRIINESVNNEAGSDDQCHCWSGWELTVLELIVIGVLSIVGIGVAIKLMIHGKSWIMIKTARRSLKNEQRKQTKAEKMRKLILEEYRSSIPAHEVQEAKEEP